MQITIEPSDQVQGPFYGSMFNSGATATDTTALATFFNVAPGMVTVTATPEGLGKPSARATIFVRAGYQTAMMLHPTP